MWRWLRGRAPDNSPEARLDQARALVRDGKPAEAVAIWTELAEAGNPRAQTNLGASYATGQGIAPDPDAARLWLGRGAEGGDPLGQRNLAILLLDTDRAAARTWFRRAAEAGDAASQDQLSRLLLDDDPAEARRWAEAAAEQGVVPAAARLAGMCHNAQGGPRDPQAAARWWEQAARGGDADSAAMLGAALLAGQGVAADPVAAMAWLVVGARRHSRLVRPFFQQAEVRLTPEQVAEARRMSGQWLP